MTPSLSTRNPRKSRGCEGADCLESSVKKGDLMTVSRDDT